MEPTNYQAALEELRNIVARLQSDLDDLDQLVALVERGNYLIDYCKTKLREAASSLP